MAKPWTDYTETLQALLPIQRGDFHGILKAMQGHWVIIRLLDPPLHEFLPSFEELLADVTRLQTAKRAGDKLYQEVLHEIRKEREKDTLTLEELEAPAGPRPRPEGAEPDARTARVPPRRRVPRDLQDAGAGHHGSRLRAWSRRASTPVPRS